MLRREGTFLDFLGELRQRQREDGDQVHRGMLWERLDMVRLTDGVLLFPWNPLYSILKINAVQWSDVIFAPGNGIKSTGSAKTQTFCSPVFPARLAQSSVFLGSVVLRQVSAGP